jgi:biopolymer transport protein ExbD
MSIHAPDRVLLHHIPIKSLRARLIGGRKRPLDATIPLVPFIDFLITLVVFLLASFGSPDTVTARPELVMPTARNAVDLEFAPIVTIDARVVTLDGRRMVETPALGERIALERIEPLVRDLETMRRSWDLLHPRQPFPATLIVQADRATDFRVIESVMFSAAQAGYANISFAVNEGD